MKYKHLIWDWNGTLLDDTWLCIESINKILLKRGMPIVLKKDYRETFSFPVKQYYETLGFDFVKESFEKISSEFIQYYRDNFHRVNLHIDTELILNNVLGSGRQQSILSASKEESLISNINFFNLENYFKKIVGIKNNLADGKIDAALLLLDSIHMKGDDILVIGDTIHDSDVAEKIGADCILIDHGYVSRERLNATKRSVFPNVLGVWNYINSF